MHPFEAKISNFIREHSLLPEGQATVIAGVSGGADSVALLVAMKALGYRCIAAHCNFRLRGAESERDRAAVMRLSLDMGVDFECVEFDTRGYCTERGIGLEEGCRELRYGWFDKLAKRCEAAAIAVAHHREDQTETFFINLIRGAGPRGLKGMQPRNGAVIRPLLDVTRSEIESYLSESGYGYVVDSSNSSAAFLRNRLRNEALPELRAAALPIDFDRAVTRSMAHIDESRRLLDSLVNAAAMNFRGGDKGWNIAAIVNSQPMPEAFVYALLAQYGFARQSTDSIVASAHESGRRFRSGSGEVWLLDRGVLRPYQTQGFEGVSTESPFMLPLSVSEISGEDFRPDRSGRVLFLDASVLAEPGIWELRRWRRGDRMQPFGMKGSRLVSDILSDAKVALDRKEDVRVLTLNGRVLWVVGYRGSALYPVTPSTERILRLEMK